VSRGDAAASMPERSRLAADLRSTFQFPRSFEYSATVGASNAWRSVHLPLAELLLDNLNPRLPEKCHRDSPSQDELLLLIDWLYDPFQIAQSIARHGYFESEPLVALETAGQRQYVVLEGNRRLAALKGLASPELRERLTQQTKSWGTLPASVDLPDALPVVLLADRAGAVPVQGFRHISGIAPWEPTADARFIVRLVAQGHSLEEVADLIGRPLAEVSSMYRDLQILRQGSLEFNLDTARAEQNFGIFTAAMARTTLRDYIQAPAPREVKPQVRPLPDNAGPRLGRLLTYVFGDDQGEGRVVQDARQLPALGDVLADPTGAAEAMMVQTKSISDAIQSIQGKGQQLQGLVRSAQQALESAQSLDMQAIDGPARDRLLSIRGSLDELLALPSPDGSGASE
jgi:hypothetical protein